MKLPRLPHRLVLVISLLLISIVGILTFKRSQPLQLIPTPAPTSLADLFPTALPTALETDNTPVPCPNPECVVVTPGPVATPLRFDLPTPGAEPISIWRPPLYPTPWALSQFDHFYFSRPIAANQVNWPLPNYRYGGVFFADVTHTGVDIPAEPGVPVIAAGPGTVIWAGWGLFSNQPGNIKDAYGQAVAIRHDFGYLGEPLFTIYAHMRAVNVVVGQWVNTGDQLGEVGDTGYTTGPHLHFEVRIGENSYFKTRNPELWIAPAQGWGVLAGRIMETDRTLIHQFAIYIRSIETGREWTVYTYGPEAVRSDNYYNENMVISDLPAGKYRVSLIYGGKRKNLNVDIAPGQITYFSFRGEYGYSTDLPPAPTLSVPPPGP